MQGGETMNKELFFQAENVLFTAVMVCYLAAMTLYFLFFVMKNEQMAKLAGGITGLGFLLHTAALLVRGIGAGRLPLTNQYEFSTSFAWGICLCFLVFLWKYHFRALGAFVTPIRAGRCGN